MTKKIPVSGAQAPLQSPFANFHVEALGALPEGRADVPVPASSPAQAGRVVLRREKAHRGGKTVVVISSLPTHLSPPELELLTKRIRKSLGCGGTLANREIEVQGDQAPRVRAFLEKEGFTVVGPG